MTAARSESASPTSFWLRHPALLALVVTVVLLLAALAWPLLKAGREPAGAVADPSAGMPWQIELLPQGGSRALGIAIGSDTLATAQARWGDDLQIIVMAAHGEAGALEASVERYSAGFITGRLILSLDVAPETLARWRGHVSKRDYIEGGTARETLQRDDLAEALRATIVGLSFIPSANLDAETVRQRFGAPAEQQRLNGLEHWLYPERGLDVALDPERRELMQYVAPRDFEARLRQPLLVAVAAASAASAASAAQ